MMRDYRLEGGPKLDAGPKIEIRTEGKPEIRLTSPKQDPKQEIRLDTRQDPKTNFLKVDLFQSTLNELHQEAPAELLHSLRERLEGIRKSIPNSTNTAEACLLGLASEKSTLLHVLTAAYLINGGVMLKHQAPEESEEEYLDFNFKDLEEELSNLSKSESSS